MPSYPVRIPGDRIPPDQKAGVVTPSGSIVTNPDGTETRRPFPHPQRTTYQHVLEVVEPARHLDSNEVAQLAMHQLLSVMEMHQHDLQKLAEDDVLETSAFVFSRVGFDWPRTEEEIKPLPMAVILQQGETVYDHSDFDAFLIEDTQDVYGEGTVLRKTSESALVLEVHCLATHKEERRGMKAAFERTLLAEPDDDRIGRRIVVPQNYDRTVRLTLLSTSYPDDGERAQGNEWEMVALLRAEVEIVTLVRRPELVQQPIIGVSVSSSS